MRAAARAAERQGLTRAAHRKLLLRLGDQQILSQSREGDQAFGKRNARAGAWIATILSAPASASPKWEASLYEEALARARRRSP